MAETANPTQTANEWNDPVETDTLFTFPARLTLWIGFGVFAFCTVISLGLQMSFYNSIFDDYISRGAEITALGTIRTMLVFSMFGSIGILIFSGGFVYAGLARTVAPDWARVTMLSVAGLSLIGSNFFSFLMMSTLNGTF